MGNKNEGNKIKIILGDFNCTMDKMDRDSQGQIQTTSTYANAEDTPSVVKLLKNTGIPILSTKLLSSFLLFFSSSSANRKD